MPKTAHYLALSPAFIFAIALIARLALVAGLYLSPVPGLACFWDTGLELGHIAQSLFVGSGFASPFGGNTGPSAMLPPAYPALVCLVFRFLGPFTVGSAWAILILQCLFSALTCIVIFSIAKRMFGEATGVVAGWLWALSPSSMIVPAFRFWETTLGTLLFSSAFLLLLRADESRHRLPWIFWGVVAGLAALVNPTTLACSIALFVWVCCRRARRAMPVLAPMLLVIATLTVALGPWIARNYFVLHRVIPLRSNFGMELWIGNHEGATGELESYLHPATNRGEFENFQRLGELEYFSEKQNEAVGFIRAHPAFFLQLSLRRVGHFWSACKDMWGFAGYGLPFVWLGLTGLALLFYLRQSLAVAFAIPLVIYPLPFYITHADARYRHAIEPFLFVLAATTLVQTVMLLKAFRDNLRSKLAHATQV